MQAIVASFKIKIKLQGQVKNVLYSTLRCCPYLSTFFVRVAVSFLQSFKSFFFYDDVKLFVNFVANNTSVVNTTKNRYEAKRAILFINMLAYPFIST